MIQCTKTREEISLNGDNLCLKQVEQIAKGAAVSIASDVEDKMHASRAFVESVAAGETPVYGVNTGFGYFSRKRIENDKLLELQKNIIVSHASGYGKPLSIPETRVAMCLRLHVLSKGYTGVRYCLCEALLHLIQAEIYPVIPESGSVGASGDLAPLAHLAMPLIGHGEVFYKNQRLPALEALKEEKLPVFELAEKEGLSLINGTQVMLAVGSLALAKACRVALMSDKITALSYEGMEARVDALYPKLHEARGQKGQCSVAARILSELEGSYLMDSHFKAPRVQDSYSLRCAPQVHGPSHDLLAFCRDKVEIELNAATDNPLVFSDEGSIVSGGNFHGQVLGMAFDSACAAVSELGNISERRIELLLNPNSSELPAFLTPYEGTHSGYMAAQYLAASLVNENKGLANPAWTDSIPGNVGVEDHVSMGMNSAKKLRKIVENTVTILSVEALLASQAIDLRISRQLGKGTERIYSLLRERVPKLDTDREIHLDVSRSRQLIEELIADL